MSHPTLRTLSGAAAPTAIDKAHTALLVIDFQNEYFDGKLPIPDGGNALRNTARLIALADRHGLPVFHIQHVTPPGSPIFAEDSHTVLQHGDLAPAPRHTVVKKTMVSAFQGTDLDAQLKAAGIEHLLITGLMTHMCVSGAARDAVPLGYSVLVAGDACATRDLDTGDGAVLPHAALHRASLATIADAFGDVLATEDILRLPVV